MFRVHKCHPFNMFALHCKRTSVHCFEYLSFLHMMENWSNEIGHNFWWIWFVFPRFFLFSFPSDDQGREKNINRFDFQLITLHTREWRCCCRFGRKTLCVWMWRKQWFPWRPAHSLGRIEIKLFRFKLLMNVMTGWLCGFSPSVRFFHLFCS